ncbi:hypothetical protein [Amycolatopsis sp. NPDC051128]|uniref:hypothetical protein n=1 Tax=Amycolatopsis sp. NPDC051128 TaxID=3155412 RepID=UPI00344295BB
MYPDNCQFIPTSAPIRFMAARKPLTGRTFNCTSNTSTKMLSEATTDSTTDTVGGEVSMGSSFSVFSFGFNLTYNQNWLKSRTVTVSRTITLNAKEVGWYDRGPALQKVTGKFVYKQTKPIEGAHFWIVGNVTVTGPDPANEEGDVIEQSRPMTAAEVTSHCVAL